MIRPTGPAQDGSLAEWPPSAVAVTPGLGYRQISSGTEPDRLPYTVYDLPLTLPAPDGAGPPAGSP
ncbi:MAG TPA: hypothetical protein VNK73_00270 [Actinomycetota bacterium]|nr:hypothetical protein [Actinomycetota bacterium]